MLPYGLFCMPRIGSSYTCAPVTPISHARIELGKIKMWKREHDSGCFIERLSFLDLLFLLPAGIGPQERLKICRVS